MTALDCPDRCERPFDGFNTGTGAGRSVLEVVETIGEVGGLDATPAVESRRPGDPAVLIGDADRIAQVPEWNERRRVFPAGAVEDPVTRLETIMYVHLRAFLAP
ncbi:MAG: hypothetical protein LBC97_05815 [Bifidobacteriaceae bacterium]|jgi:UDP-glucose 4-epimerase|nr:hypothetical protein [Bifidobacteriaceae bacterium]